MESAFRLVVKGHRKLSTPTAIAPSRLDSLARPAKATQHVDWAGRPRSRAKIARVSKSRAGRSTKDCLTLSKTPMPNIHPVQRANNTQSKAARLRYKTQARNSQQATL